MLLSCECKELCIISESSKRPDGRLLEIALFFSLCSWKTEPQPSKATKGQNLTERWQWGQDKNLWLPDTLTATCSSRPGWQDGIFLSFFCSWHPILTPPPTRLRVFASALFCFVYPGLPPSQQVNTTSHFQHLTASAFWLQIFLFSGPNSLYSVI